MNKVEFTGDTSLVIRFSEPIATGGVDAQARQGVMDNADAIGANNRAIMANARAIADLQGGPDVSALTDRLDAIEADDWVTSRRMAGESVTEGILADGAVTGRKIARGTVGEIQLGANSVGNSQLRGDAVGTAEIRDDAVTEQKLDAAARTKLNRQTGVDNVARRDAGNALRAAQGAQTTADENRVEISAEETQRRAGDANLADQIANVRAFIGGTQMRVEPGVVPDVNSLVRNYTLHIASLQGIPDEAVKVVVSAGILDVGGIHLAWDNNWIRTRRTIPLTRFNQQALTGLLNSGALHRTDHSLSVQVGFYPATFPDNGQQEPASALAYFTTAILIGDGLDLPADFTRRDEAKLDRYDENPRANGAAFSQPLVLLEQYAKTAVNNSDFTANNITRGQFQSRTENRGGESVDVVKLGLLDDDLGSTDYWLASPNAAVVFGQVDDGGTLSVTPILVNVPDSAKPWLLQMVFAENSGVVGLGNEAYRVQGQPKFSAGGPSGADLSQVEDFARKDRNVDVRADKTLNPLFAPDSISFNFGASTADPTASGSFAQVIGRPTYGTALSDTAVVTEVNAIANAVMTLTQSEVTHEGALVIVDCDLANLASDRFTGVELILRTVTGTVVSRHSLPSSATSTNRNLRFPLIGLAAGGDLQFALGATVRGREQQVIATLSNLRYQRDGTAPAESFVRDWAKQEVAKEAAVHEARDARIEQELLTGDQTLPAPTGVGARRSPTWAAATSTHQDQTDADAFTIPANGYAQFHSTGEAAWASPILHVNEWRVPQTFIVYADATGSILLISDGTRVRLRNRNAAGTGAYPNRSLLLLGRGFQWFTWPEAPPAAGNVTVLTEAQIRALIDQVVRSERGTVKGPLYASMVTSAGVSARISAVTITSDGASAGMSTPGSGVVNGPRNPDIAPAGVLGYWVQTWVGSEQKDEIFLPWGPPISGNVIAQLKTGDSNAANEVQVAYRDGENDLRFSIANANAEFPGTEVRVLPAVARGEKGDRGGPNRFERDIGASPTVLPEGSFEISVKMSQGANRVQKRLLLSQITAANERYRLRIGNANVDFNVSYNPGTRTLTYSGANASAIKVIGEA